MLKEKSFAIVCVGACAAIQLCYATYTAIRHCASTVLPFLAGREENKKQPSEQSSRGAAWAWSQGGGRRVG